MSILNYFKNDKSATDVIQKARGGQQLPVKHLNTGYGQGAVTDDGWHLIKTSRAHRMIDPYVSNSAVCASIAVASESIAQTPRVIEVKDGRSREQKWRPVEDHPFEKLFQNPNSYQDIDLIFEGLNTWYDLKGEAFIVMPRNSATEIPEQMYLVEPHLMDEVLDDNGNILGWKFQGEGTKESVFFGFFEVLHFRNFNPYDRYRGFPKWLSAKNSYELDVKANQFNQAFFSNPSTVSGVLTYEGEGSLTKEQMDEIQDKLKDTYGGADRAHKILALNKHFKFTASNFSLKDISFQGLKNLTVEETYRIFETNPVVLGDNSDVKSYEGVKVAWRMFWNSRLIPRINRIETIFQDKFFRWIQRGRYRLKFDLNDVEALQQDYNEKLDQAIKLKNLNYPINMINEKLDLGMDEVEWGNEPPERFEMPSLGLPDDTTRQTTQRLPAKNNEPDDIEVIEIEPKLKEFIQKRMLDIQTKAESRFNGKVRKWLMSWRSKVLKRFNETAPKGKTKDHVSKDIIDDILADSEAKREFEGFIRDLYIETYMTGVGAVVEEVASDRSEVIIQPLQRSALLFAESKAPKVAGWVVSTVREKLRQEVSDSITNGEDITQTQKRIRDSFNTSLNRSLTIARTESASAINNGRFSSYEKTDVAFHAWIDAKDTNVRQQPSHRLSGRWRGKNEVVAIGQTFSNGLRHPHDPRGSASNKINCRCRTIPVKRDEKGYSLNFNKNLINTYQFKTDPKIIDAEYERLEREGESC